MDFKRVTRRQNEPERAVEVSLREISEETAKSLLGDVQERDALAWALMFGDSASTSWTAARLSEFRDLYSRLQAGRLAWVLSTGLPLHSDFRVWLDGVMLESSKEKLETLFEFVVGSESDPVAASLGLTKTSSGVLIEGIGEISGHARLFKKKLTEGKSDQYQRSNGFFIRVRNRVINLEDELFGLPALNHAAWSRFSMEIDAEGLRDFLLSSREGVRDDAAVDCLHKYLHQVFNVCRNEYEAWERSLLEGIDVSRLLKDAPTIWVTEPLVSMVETSIAGRGESYYLETPELSDDQDERDRWVEEFKTKVEEQPIASFVWEKSGSFDRSLRYDPVQRSLAINQDHPFIDKLVNAEKRSNSAAALFGSAELIMDGLLQQHGLRGSALSDFMRDRDRVLRLLAGEQPATVSEVLRQLDTGHVHETAFEVAVGRAFELLGFSFEERGGNSGGCDGVLDATLGRSGERSRDFRIVYDAKQTNSPKVAAQKLDITALEKFRNDEGANYAFFIARDYDASLDSEGALNARVRQETSGADAKKVTLLRTSDLVRVIKLHARFGVTLTDLESFFETAHTVPEVQDWLDDYEQQLLVPAAQVPLLKLLQGVEHAQTDRQAAPNIRAVRATNPELLPFTPDKLGQVLRAVQTVLGPRWIEVVDASLDVKLHATAAEIANRMHVALDAMSCAGPSEVSEE